MPCGWCGPEEAPCKTLEAAHRVTPSCACAAGGGGGEAALAAEARDIPLPTNEPLMCTCVAGSGGEAALAERHAVVPGWNVLLQGSEHPLTKASNACAAGANGGEAALAERHAVVLGLKAFVLAAPYDVPPWLPGVLLALVRASGQPPPVKTSVRCVQRNPLLRTGVARDTGRHRCCAAHRNHSCTRPLMMHPAHALPTSVRLLVKPRRLLLIGALRSARLSVACLIRAFLLDIVLCREMVRCGVPLVRNNYQACATGGYWRAFMHLRC